MKPHLRHGKVNGARPRISATTWNLCKCESYGCRDTVSVHPETQQVLHGRFIALQEFTTHRRAEQARKDLHALQAAADSDLPSSHPSPVQQPSKGLQSALSRSTSSKKAQKNLERLMKLQAEFHSYDTPLDKMGPLVFQNPPCLNVEDHPKLPRQLGLNTGPYALLVNSECNSEYIDQEEKLLSFLTKLDTRIGDGEHDDLLGALKAAVEVRFSHLQDFKVQEWKRQRREGLVADQISSESLVTQSWANVNPIVIIAYVILGVMHFICGLSIAHSTFILRALKKIVELAFLSRGDLFVAEQQILNSFPGDARTVFKKFDIESDTISYVCCPKCYKCYLIDPNNPNAFPERCTNKPMQTSAVCNRTLRKSRTFQGVEYSLPTRRYIYHDMKKWVGRLLSRPGMEEVLDRKYSPSFNPARAPDGYCDDIMGSKVLREFLGPDGEPFLASSGRLIFSLSMDGFNPYRKNAAGKKVSVGAIYMVCLNLPPEIRYRFENMYLVGIIPGPSEPSVDQINYLLKPLVDDLLEFWDPGVLYSYTPSHPGGRRIQCAVIPLVCDLPAVRQMAGFASYSAKNFCSMCQQSLDNINNLDITNWKRRTCQEHRRLAEQWKNATSEKQRHVLFNEHGLRYSQLLELPYWDPTLFTLIDSMHAFFLGDLKRHCRDVWGMDVTFADGDGSWVDPGPESSSALNEKDIHDAWRHLRISKESVLKREVTKAVLQHLCRETQTLPEPRYRKKKDHLINALVQYRISQGWFDNEGNRISIPDPSELPPEQPLHVRVQEAKEALKMYSKTAFTKEFKKDVVAHLSGSILKIPLEEAQVTAKKDLVDALYRWRVEKGWTNEKGKILVAEHHQLKPRRQKKTVVLGEGVMREVWKDMGRTLLPPWIAPAPAQIGTSKTGKLSADQWRTTATVHLVTTLVRLWGANQSNSRRYRMLTNFMDLVTATKLATMRTMSTSRIDLYNLHMRRYLKNYLDLYQDVGLTPNQHLSLHFGEVLHNFGPTHGWRSWVFERMNYKLQEVSTNKKFGELEITMSESFRKAQQLHVMIIHGRLPSELNGLVEDFHKIFDSDERGTLLSDTLAFSRPLSPIPPRGDAPKFRLNQLTHGLLVQWSIANNRNIDCSDMARRHKSLVLHGAKFEARETGFRAESVFIPSLVAFGKELPNEFHVGCVQQIFTHSDEVFLILQTFNDLDSDDKIYDYYRAFPYVGGRIYYQSTHQDLILIHWKEVISHIAYTPSVSESIKKAHFLALPLDRN